MDEFKLKYKLILKVEDFFSLYNTLFCGQCFRWQQNKDKFSCVVKGEYVEVLKKENLLYIYSNMPLDKNEWIHYFSLNLNYQKLHEEFCKDDTLKKCVESAKGIRVLNQEFFETLISFIISQNNNIPRISSIINTFCQKFGKKVYENYYSFPTIEDLKEVTLDDLAILKAGFRAKYILDAIKKVSNGDVTESKLKKLNTDEARKLLMTIKGVGPKVSDCVLLFSLNRTEVLPKDVWIKKALEELFPNGLPKCCTGYEGIAQQYIFDS